MDLQSENEQLRQRIHELEAQLGHHEKAKKAHQTSTTERVFGEGHLTKHQIERYSRQMLLGDIGSVGTRILLNSRVLVVGAGGLGSTVIPYLAAAGVGRIIVVDFDTVDESNLHRQVIHTEARVGMQKALSAKIMANNLNSEVQVEAVCSPFSVSNAQQLCREADVVIDASDNVACRYLVNDAAVMEGKPLVSGSATRWEGQLTVYNCPNVMPSATTSLSTAQNSGVSSASNVVQPDHGPCYRCLFPTPPPTSAVGSCNEVGVVGPIPGTIGCLQALEAIKVLLLLGKRGMINISDKRNTEIGSKRIRDEGEDNDNATATPSTSTNKINIEVLSGRMLLFDGLRSTYRTIKLRGKQPTCSICNASQRSFQSLQEAHHQQNLFPEYETGVACELPDSAPRVDGGDNALAKTTGIDCKEERMVDFAAKYPNLFLQDSSDVECPSNNSSKGSSGSSSPIPIVVDVRPASQQAMFTLPHTTFILNYDTFENHLSAHSEDILRAVKEKQRQEQGREAQNTANGAVSPTIPVYFLCRRGNKSRKAIFALAPLLQSLIAKEKDGNKPDSNGTPKMELVNLVGGLTYWTNEVDPTFPVV